MSLFLLKIVGKASHSACYVALDSGACPVADAYRSRIFSFDPLEGWINQAGVGMHYHVDILKRTCVRIGPGSSFACKFLQLDDTKKKQSNDEPKQQLSCVGLIPTAVGATSLSEWAPDYLSHIPLLEASSCSTRPLNIDITNSPHLSSPPFLPPAAFPSLSSSSSKALPPPPPLPSSTDLPSFPPSLPSQYIPHCDSSGFLIPPLNAQYHDGCPNLLSCAMRSLYLALKTLPRSINADKNINAFSKKPTTIGFLWYQGENDATEDISLATSYGKNVDTHMKCGSCY